jgi:ribose 5-phosphate isomerase A
MNLKQQAAEYALNFVKSGMFLGLGTGSTTSYFIELLGERLRAGTLQDIQGVPTSKDTVTKAMAAGIPLTTLANIYQHRTPPLLDLAVDGADEIDPDLNMIKGLGRALLREKIVEINAARFIIIVDESKIVPRLGTRCPLPVEITPFEADANVQWLNSLGCRAELWREEDGSLVVTDNGNYLALCRFEGGIPNAHALALVLAERPGVVEHGLFLEMVTKIIVASPTGIRAIEADRISR